MRWVALCWATAAIVQVACPVGAAARLRWSGPVHVGHGGIDALACPTPNLCVAGSAGGLLVSKDPDGAASSWVLTLVPPAPSSGGPGVVSVSCPSKRFCGAITLAGDLLTSTNPSGGPSAWQLTHLRVPAGFTAMPQISCGTRTRCVVIAAGSRAVFSSANPVAGVRAWHTTQLAHPLETVTCTGARLCIIGDDHGDVLSQTRPGPVWHSVFVAGPPGHGTRMGPSACATPTYCFMAAAAQVSDLLMATDPTGDPNTSPDAWRDSAANPTHNSFFVTGACAGRHFCAFLDTSGTVYFTGKTFRDTTHTQVDHPSARTAGGGISCASTQWCALGGLDGSVYIGAR